MPRRCLHGVHPETREIEADGRTLPRRCLHGVHPSAKYAAIMDTLFASALPARGASIAYHKAGRISGLCLGAACTGCIGKSRQIAAHLFVAYAVSR